MLVSKAGLNLILSNYDKIYSVAKNLSMSEFTPEDILKISEAKNLVIAGAKLINLEKDLSEIILRVLD